MFATFLPTIPTNQPFLGCPVMPSDKYHWHIDLPIITPEAPVPPSPPVRHFKSIIQQFQSTLLPWQWPLFGPIWKLQPVHQLCHLSNTKQPIAIVSNALVQKDHQSGFSWVITNYDSPLWKGVGLAPGHAEDMHSGQAEAFGILAALIFLSHYIQCYGTHLFSESISKCYCNNSGVVITITDLCNSTTMHPNGTTNNDHNVYLAINKTIFQCAPLTL